MKKIVKKDKVLKTFFEGKNISKFAFMVLGLLCVVSSVFAGNAENVQHVLWNKNIIPIQIPIGKEKIIEVCAPSDNPSECTSLPLTPYLPQNEISSGILKWINNAGTLYLTATKPFANKLTELKINNRAGDVILLRLSATKSADDNRIEIMLPNAKSGNNSVSNNSSNKGQEDKSLGTMIRWVAQQLYAPKRLLTQPGWIFRIPMHTNRFVPLYRGAVVSSMPLASWRAGNYYISAVLLRNVLKNQRVYLKHNMIRGKWIAISFFRQSFQQSFKQDRLHPSILTPARTDRDSTTAILISTVSFDAALKEG